jgi:hypothetical protein
MDSGASPIPEVPVLSFCGTSFSGPPAYTAGLLDSRPEPLRLGLSVVHSARALGAAIYAMMRFINAQIHAGLARSFRPSKVRRVAATTAHNQN